MDLKELFKFQMVGGAGGLGGTGGQPLSFWDQLWSLLPKLVFLVAMMFSEELTKQLPNIVNAIKSRYCSKYTDLVKHLDPTTPPIAQDAVPLKERHYVNHLRMTRYYDAKTPASYADSNSLVDAVLAHIAKQDNVPSFQLIHSAHVMVSYREKPIQIAKDVYLKVEEIEMEAEGMGLHKLKIVLMSNSVSAADITRFVRQLHDVYVKEQANALGDTIFFFEQKAGKNDGSGDPRGMPSMNSSKDDALAAKRMRIATASRNLTFTRTAFCSNKRFDNIFGEDVRLVEQRVRFFMDNKEWYDRHGIPYQLGIMLSGVPGSGEQHMMTRVCCASSD
jgi:hypothetical protein